MSDLQSAIERSRKRMAARRKRDEVRRAETLRKAEIEMGGPSRPFPDPRIEGVACATARVLLADGRAMASQYLVGALENLGLLNMVNFRRSKMKLWEVQAVADRALWISQHAGNPAAVSA